MALPTADPQFWIVSAVAAIALAFVFRRVFRRERPGELPCARCKKGHAKM